MHLSSCENSFIVLQVQGVFANALLVMFSVFNNFKQIHIYVIGVSDVWLGRVEAKRPLVPLDRAAQTAPPCHSPPPPC